jgi:septum formation protein
MAETTGPRVILASGSESRRKLLVAAGITFDVVPSSVDEPALRQSLEKGGGASSPEAVARALAEAKAVEVSKAHPEALVIGGDQVLALGKRILEKPANVEAARRQLAELRGRMHDLISAVVVAREGTVEWGHVETATMTVRLFGTKFLESYLAQAGEAVCQSVGAYQLEGLGAQLFEQIDGDYFTILGLPLIALLGELRRREVIET